MKLATAVLSALVVSFVGPVEAQFENVGYIEFPTSGSPEAQKHFLRGVAILHSFGWKQAIEQFQAAQKLDPDFAMAYWGESLCYNHPLITERDMESPRNVLKRYAPSPAERVAKAPTDREKGFINAVNILFDEGATKERRVGYMEAMRRLYEKYPDDHEVALYYALSLLSAARAVDDLPFRMEVRAGTIAMKVFSENPNHPGAAHYTIHSFDDPIHAPLALPAARRFADIAGAVSHARHMPSHIFIQHGMWKEVSRSNQSGYDAAKDLWVPGDSVDNMVHALDWGQYGDLQHGDYKKAKMWMGVLDEIVEKSDGAERAVNTVPLLKARYIVETEEWKTEPVTEESSTHELLATGLSAVKLGNLATAEKAEARLADIARNASDDEISYYSSRVGKPAKIMHKQVAALVEMAKGNNDKAIELIEEGVRIAESMRPPSGAANPVKPVHELYGEMLLEMGKPAEAIEVFKTSLRRMPNRPLGLLGLARAYAATGDRLQASEQYEKLAKAWEGRDFPALEEAKSYLPTPTDAP